MNTSLYTLTQLHTEKTLKRKWQSATHHTEKVRWHGLYLLKKGVDPTIIASTLDRNMRWLRMIVLKFNAQGSAGVTDRRGSNGGHNKLLNKHQSQKLYDQIVMGVAPDGGLWTGPKIATWIAKEINKPVASSRGWKYTRQLGLSLVTQRPTHIAAASAQQQKDFKKN